MAQRGWKTLSLSLAEYAQIAVLVYAGHLEGWSAVLSLLGAHVVGATLASSSVRLRAGKPPAVRSGAGCTDEDDISNLCVTALIAAL